MTTMELISEANAIALMFVEGGVEAHDAMDMVLSHFALDEVYAADDGSTVIYRTESGELINRWNQGHTSDEIGEGGLGFDENIEWYTQRG